MTWLLNLPPQASTMAPRIDHFHYMVIGTTFAGVAAVVLVTLWFVLRPRAYAPRLVSPRGLDLAIGGALLALFLAWWIIGFRQYRDIETPPANAARVYVDAKQWMWKFSEPSGRTSTDVLTVPAGQPIELVMTSRDVIHSFFVPAFRIKQDVVPGRATHAWFTATEPGSYDILCSQYCGARHSLMRGRVDVLAPADYARWNAAHDPSQLAPGSKGDGADLAAHGHDVAAARGCLRCHAVAETGPTIGPSWHHAYGARRQLTSGATVTVDDAYLTEAMMDPLAHVAAGFAPVMPSYQGVLSPAEIGAILEYIRSLR